MFRKLYQTFSVCISIVCIYSTRYEKHPHGFVNCAMFVRIPPWLNAFLLVTNFVLLLVLLDSFVVKSPVQGTDYIELHRRDESEDNQLPIVRSTTSASAASGTTHLNTLKPITTAAAAHLSTSLSKKSQDGHPFRHWDFNWDGRHADYLAGNGSSAWRYLFLIRHGQYHREPGPLQRHLTDLGRLQAERTGQRLKGMNISYQRMITSTSIRARETAKIIHKYVPYVKLEETDWLREGWPSYPEPPFPLWNPKDPQFLIDGSRIAKGFGEYFHRADPYQKENSREIIVAHGNVIGYYILRLLQLDRERWLRVGINQASITRVWLHPDGLVTVKALGDVGHLPMDEWTD